MDVYRKRSSSYREKLSISWDKIVKIPRWGPYDVVGVIFFAAFVISTSFFYFNEWQFNAEDWKRAPSKRHEMVDDLLDSEILVEKSKEEVLMLLGEPYSDIDKNRDIFRYRLGTPPSFFKPEREQLFIVFEKNMVVSVALANE